jgi:ketosteroid isomerase-like protein
VVEVGSEQQLATVQGLYEAFGRGDVPAILGMLSEDVAFDRWADNHGQAAGVPWLTERHGHEGAGEFFGVVGTLDMADFQVLSLMAGGDQVVAEVVIEFTTPEGGHLRDEELHLWTFGDDGKVKRLRHYTDTAKHMAAARAGSAAAASGSRS